MKIFRWTALLLTLAVSAIAQTQPAKYQTVFTVNVKPGMTQQYETYVKKIVEAAEKIGDVQNWATFNLTVGGGRRAICLRPGVRHLGRAGFLDVAAGDAGESVRRRGGRKDHAFGHDGRG